MKSAVIKTSALYLVVLSVTFSIGCSDDDGASGSNRPPILEVEEFEISEGAQVGSSVGIVKSIDQDGDVVSFSITAGNGEDKFEINTLSGEISLSAELDYETTASYILTIRCDDGNDFVEEDFTIYVLDIDETVNSILGTWNVISNEVTYDGGLEGDWAGFVLEFTGVEDAGSFSSVSTPSGYEDVWPGNGEWERTEDFIVRTGNTGQIEMEYFVDETTLMVTFIVPDPSGRINGLYGAPWVFKFNKSE